MGPPETTSREYVRGDESWAIEFAEFLEDIRLGRMPSAGLADARAALVVVEAVYRRSNVAWAQRPEGGAPGPQEQKDAPA